MLTKTWKDNPLEPNPIQSRNRIFRGWTKKLRGIFNTHEVVGDGIRRNPWRIWSLTILRFCIQAGMLSHIFNGNIGTHKIFQDLNPWASTGMWAVLPFPAWEWWAILRWNMLCWKNTHKHWSPCRFLLIKRKQIQSSSNPTTTCAAWKCFCPWLHHIPSGKKHWDSRNKIPLTTYASRKHSQCSMVFGRGTISWLARMARPYSGKGSQWQSEFKESCKGNHQMYLVSYSISRVAWNLWLKASKTISNSDLEGFRDWKALNLRRQWMPQKFLILSGQDFRGKSIIGLELFLWTLEVQYQHHKYLGFWFCHLFHSTGL